MNEMGIALAWCAIQVTLMGLLAAAVYLPARRIRPTSGSWVVLASLVAIAALTAIAFSPWPQWGLATGAPQAASVSEGIDIPSTFSGDAGTTAASAADQPGSGGALPGPRSTDSDSSFSASVFWQALVDELTSRPAPADGSKWRWPAGVAVAFVLAVGTGALWLMVALLAVRTYRFRSRPIDDARLLEQADTLRAELGCRQKVQLRQSDDLVTAAAIGWRRPMILLPAEWTGWTEAQQRAVLAHEIAHVRSRDFLASLLGLLGLLLHFYHPLVHWLMGRLRLEQELAADAAAASISGGQRKYLTALAELALRQPDRPVALPARTFLPTRNTFLRRIAMLRDSKLHADRPSWGTRVLALAAVVLCGVLVAGLRGPSGEWHTGARAADPAAEERPAAGAEPSAIDLTHVPPDAAAIMVIRPAAILARPELAEFRKLVAEAPRLGPKLGIGLDKLEQATWLTFIPSPGEGGEPAPIELAALILQASQPHDFEEATSARFQDLVKKEFRGRTYFAGKFGGKPSAYYRPDDRTVILGFEKDIRRMIAGPRGGRPEFLTEETWAQCKEDQVLVAAQSHVIHAVLRSPESRDFRSAVAPVAPFWTETTSFAIGARVEERLHVHGAAFARDQQGASRVRETLQAIMTLARNMADGLRQQPEQIRALPSEPRSLSPQEAFAAWGRSKQGAPVVQSVRLMGADLLAGLADNSRLETAGTVVRFRTSAEVSAPVAGRLAEAIGDARNAACRTMSANNLKQIALAMLNYHDVHGHYPPAVLYGPDGKTPHSWRVALLPFLEAEELSKQYRFHEPWDSPNNLSLLEKMPRWYRSPKDVHGSTNASIFVLSGPGTVFDDKEGTAIREVVDGTHFTLLAVECKRDVPWTKPEDIPYDPDEPLPKLGGYYEGGFNAASCDGSCRFISGNVKEEVLRALITKAGGETIPPGSF